MSWLKRLFTRRALERDLDREMRFHLDAAIADHVRAGLPHDEARRRAYLDFGGPEQMKEATRDVRGTRWVEEFASDCRFAVRGMRRSPAFAAAAILTIAIGVGANTAVWSIMDALMRRALPIERPEELHAIKRVGIEDDQYLVSHPVMQEMQRELKDAAQLAAIGTIVRAYVTIGDQPESALGLPISGNFFDVLGVRPSAGRLVSAADDREMGGSPVIVITDAFWERRFGRDPGTIGRSIRVNGFPVIIAGVAQPGFGGLTVGNPVDFFAPLAMHHPLRLRGNNRSSNGDNNQPWVPQREISWLTLVTRANEADRARLSQVVDRPFRAYLETEYAQRDSADRAFGMKEHAMLEPIPRGFSSLRTAFRDPLRALLGGVALILLITCANLAGLVLARGEARSSEMAIRSSLGAMSGRLARQLTAESLTLAFIGGAMGLVLAQWMTRALLALASTGTSAIPLDATLNGPVLLFAFGITVFAGLVVGLAPAWRVRRFNLYSAIRAGGRGSGGAHRLPLGRVLVGAQIALALVLVTAAGLFARTFANFVNVDAGFARETVVSARIELRSAGYTVDQLPGVYQRLVDGARGVAGAQSAGLAVFPLGSGQRRTVGLSIPGRPLPPGQNDAQENFVTAGYFKTAGIALLRGRDFTTADAFDRPRVAVVSESFAKHFFGTTEVLGKRYGHGDGRTGDSIPPFEIVGVVRDTRINGLKDAVPRLAWYPLAQAPTEFAQSLDVRIAGRPEPVINGLRAAVAMVDRRLPVREVTTIGSFVERGLSRERLVARLVGSFGLLALILAAIGLYGVISYSVARRTNEMGVRLALGASPAGVSWIVLRDSLWLVVAGLVAGVMLWFPVLGLTRTLVYGVSPHDPGLLAASVGVLVIVGVAAGVIPAIKASRIDPIEAIRAD